MYFFQKYIEKERSPAPTHLAHLYVWAPHANRQRMGGVPNSLKCATKFQ